MVKIAASWHVPTTDPTEVRYPLLATWRFCELGLCRAKRKRRVAVGVAALWISEQSAENARTYFVAVAVTVAVLVTVDVWITVDEPIRLVMSCVGALTMLMVMSLLTTKF